MARNAIVAFMVMMLMVWSAESVPLRAMSDVSVDGDFLRIVSPRPERVPSSRTEALPSLPRGRMIPSDVNEQVVASSPPMSSRRREESKSGKERGTTEPIWVKRTQPEDLSIPSLPISVSPRRLFSSASTSRRNNIPEHASRRGSSSSATFPSSSRRTPSEILRDEQFRSRVAEKIEEERRRQQEIAESLGSPQTSYGIRTSSTPPSVDSLLDTRPSSQSEASSSSSSPSPSSSSSSFSSSSSSSSSSSFSIPLGPLDPSAYDDLTYADYQNYYYLDDTETDADTSTSKTGTPINPTTEGLLTSSKTEPAVGKEQTVLKTLSRSTTPAGENPEETATTTFSTTIFEFLRLSTTPPTLLPSVTKPQLLPLTPDLSMAKSQSETLTTTAAPTITTAAPTTTTAPTTMMTTTTMTTTTTTTTAKTKTTTSSVVELSPSPRTLATKIKPTLDKSDQKNEWPFRYTTLAPSVKNSGGERTSNDTKGVPNQTRRIPEQVLRTRPSEEKKKPIEPEQQRTAPLSQTISLKTRAQGQEMVTVAPSRLGNALKARLTANTRNARGDEPLQIHKKQTRTTTTITDQKPRRTDSPRTEELGISEDQRSNSRVRTRPLKHVTSSRIDQPPNRMSPGAEQADLQASPRSEHTGRASAPTSPRTDTAEDQASPKTQQTATVTTRDLTKKLTLQTNATLKQQSSTTEQRSETTTKKEEVVSATEDPSSSLAEAVVEESSASSTVVVEVRVVAETRQDNIRQELLSDETAGGEKPPEDKATGDESSGTKQDLVLAAPLLNSTSLSEGSQKPVAAPLTEEDAASDTSLPPVFEVLSPKGSSATQETSTHRPKRQEQDLSTAATTNSPAATPVTKLSKSKSSFLLSDPLVIEVRSSSLTTTASVRREKPTPSSEGADNDTTTSAPVFSSSPDSSLARSVTGNRPEAASFPTAEGQVLLGQSQNHSSVRTQTQSVTSSVSRSESRARFVQIDGHQKTSTPMAGDARLKTKSAVVSGNGTSPSSNNSTAGETAGNTTSSAGASPRKLVDSLQGLMPTGIMPFGLAPEGLAPFGEAPEGLHPLGLSPAGLIPLGLHLSNLTGSNTSTAASGGDGPTLQTEEGSAKEKPPKGNQTVVDVVSEENVRRYRLEEKTSDGFIIGEYGVVDSSNGDVVQGVRYTADGSVDPKLLRDTLQTFLSL